MDEGRHVRVGDLLGQDPECLLLVLAVDGDRLLLLDLLDDARPMWMTPRAPAVLSAGDAAGKLASIEVAAVREMQRARELEMEATEKRANAAQLRAKLAMARQVRDPRE